MGDAVGVWVALLELFKLLHAIALLELFKLI
jgi:hypothetical protein